MTDAGPCQSFDLLCVTVAVSSPEEAILKSSIELSGSQKGSCEQERIYEQSVFQELGGGWPPLS